MIKNNLNNSQSFKLTIGNTIVDVLCSFDIVDETEFDLIDIDYIKDALDKYIHDKILPNLDRSISEEELNQKLNAVLSGVVIKNEENKTVIDDITIDKIKILNKL